MELNSAEGDIVQAVNRNTDHQQQQLEVDDTLPHVESFLTEILHGYDKKADKSTQTVFKTDRTGTQVLSVFVNIKEFKKEC